MSHFNNEGGYTLADIGAVMRGGYGGWGGFGDGGIIGYLALFLIFSMFGFGGFGGWGGFGGMGGFGGASNGYVLSQDMSMLSRQMSDGFGAVEKDADTIRNGLCDLGYASLQQTNGINQTVLDGFYRQATQIAECCCQLREAISGAKYDTTIQLNGISREIERGFCESMYRDKDNTTSIIQNQHNDTDRLMEKLCAMENKFETNHLREQLEAERLKNQRLEFEQSQKAQTAQIWGFLQDRDGCRCPA